MVPIQVPFHVEVPVHDGVEFRELVQVSDSI